MYCICSEEDNTGYCSKALKESNRSNKADESEIKRTESESKKDSKDQQEYNDG